MNDCLFCKIVEGELDAKIIYEDDYAVAFLDIAPWQKGHCLVIPRTHVENVFSEPDALSNIAPAVTAVGRLVQRAMAADGINVVSNAGKVAGQEVFHAHVHIVPRYQDAPGLDNLRGQPEVHLDEVHRAIVSTDN